MKGSLRKIMIIGGIALAVWGAFNLYPQLQSTENNDFNKYPDADHWSYGLDVKNGTKAIYNVYHVSLERNVTVSYTVVDTNVSEDTWRVAIEASDGEVRENAYAITRESILPVGGSQIVGELDRFEVATKMPVAEFMMGLKDQPLAVGARWQMAFLAPDNTYTRSYIVEKQSVNGNDIYVLKYGPEKTPSYAWVSKQYPIPLRDEYREPLSGEIISVYELIEYE